MSCIPMILQCHRHVQTVIFSAFELDIQLLDLPRPSGTVHVLTDAPISIYVCMSRKYWAFHLARKQQSTP